MSQQFLRRLVAGVPLVWMVVFFLLPFVLVLKIALSKPEFGQPPYQSLWQAGWNGTWDNFALLLQDDLYRDAFFGSAMMASVTTIICFLIGFPMAYAMARASERYRHLLLLAIMIPFWTSFLIRVYAWTGILRNNGLLNHFLLSVGLIDTPLAIINTPVAIYIGLVYSYLPFMILPLYSTLEKMDWRLVEAAMDLGAGPFKAFLTTTLPLAVPGIVAGSWLVLIPVTGEYVIPALLGSPDTKMIGRVLWDEFFQNRDWPVASALATLLIVLLVLPLMMWQIHQQKQQERA